MFVPLLLLACHPDAPESPGDSSEDTAPATSDDTGSIDSADTAPPDSGDTADTADTAGSCPDEPPADVDVPIAACPPTAALSLRLVWLAPVSINGPSQLAAARMADDNGDGVVDAADPMRVLALQRVAAEQGVEMFRGDNGAPVGERLLPEAYQAGFTLADVDASRPGAELAAGWTTFEGEGHLGVVGVEGTTWGIDTEAHPRLTPFVLDVDGDGALEILAEWFVFDAATGAVKAVLEGFEGDEHLGAVVAADLDLDGAVEIAVTQYDRPGVTVFGPDGAERARCDGGGGSVGVAVGNLDDDADGELLVVGEGWLAVCDADGTRIAYASSESWQPTVWGLGELDGDPSPEIVVSGAGGLDVYDADLQWSWSWDGGETGWRHAPFTLADLDADGLHEVVIRSRSHLAILGNHGEERVLQLLGLHGTSTGAPVVADIDADGFAEIITADDGAVYVYESADSGWVVPGADAPSPGLGHYPGSRDAVGGVGAVEPWWTEANVWQGLPTRAPTAAPDLGVEVVGVCTESCNGAAVVTVRVSNAGTGTSAPATLTVSSAGVLLATRTVEALESGVGRHLTVRVPANAVIKGVSAVLDAAGGTCDGLPAEADGPGSGCP